ncbi:MAG: hypothetical protein ACT4P1_11025 [Sporichthyaceae bacterium]
MAAVFGMVVHLLGPAAHADGQAEARFMALSANNHTAPSHADPGGNGPHDEAGLTSLDVVDPADKVVVAAGSASHDDSSCGSPVRPVGPALNHLVLACAPPTSMSRSEDVAARVPAAALAIHAVVGELRTPGVQRI